ncbi:MAG TPA: UpxY family transcription antiterminator [Pelobium sp.]|nr:UpxY family transcription antiterminator [Pelobium sp.]
MENALRSTLNKKRWLVIYTRPKWEKKVDLTLKQRGINSFCPLKVVQSRWADRWKTVEIPLFTSYVFVNVNLKEEQIVRQTYGVINFIYFLGKPAVIRDGDMDKFREILLKNPEAEVLGTHQLSAGDKVKIKQGLLCNQEGSILKINGKTVLMVFDNLDTVLVSRVSTDNLSLVSNH